MISLSLSLSLSFSPAKQGRKEASQHGICAASSRSLAPPRYTSCYYDYNASEQPSSPLSLSLSRVFLPLPPSLSSTPLCTQPYSIYSARPVPLAYSLTDVDECERGVVVVVGSKVITIIIVVVVSAAAWREGRARQLGRQVSGRTGDSTGSNRLL